MGVAIHIEVGTPIRPFCVAIPLPVKTGEWKKLDKPRSVPINRWRSEGINSIPINLWTCASQELCGKYRHQENPERISTRDLLRSSCWNSLLGPADRGCDRHSLTRIDVPVA